MIRQIISHYKILEKLGEGGMGIVYKAEDTKLKRLVALKFLPSQSFGGEEEKSRFVHEAQTAATLMHPNVAAIFDFEEVEGQSFIVMEFVDGKSLKEKIESGPLKLDEVLDISIQVAEGLQEAHDKGIIHRDIKSANIMMTEKGQAKIMDFGLAKSLGQTKLTKIGTTVGTVAYMSPEQARGEEVDHRTDIWSLGVVLYEIVTGQLPFKGDYEQAVMYCIMNEAPEPLRNLRTDAPKELEQVIHQALEKDRDQRFQSVNDILQCLWEISGEGRIFGTKVADLGSLLQLLRRPRVAIATLAIFVLVAAAVFIPYRRLVRLQHAKELLPQIENLANEGKYFEAYALAVQAEKHLKDDSTFVRLMPIISDKLTIITQPEGARVYLKRFAPDEQGKFPESKYIGETPVVNLRLARSYYKVYLQKEGYDPVERIASSTLSRDEQYPDLDVEIKAKLLEAEKVPENMVFVPGGRYSLVGWNLPTTAEVQLDDSFMDKYEVSNKEYKAFIEAGGYLKKQYWKYPFRKDGNELSWEQAMQQFTDRTGLPGPRTWVNQRFPEGKGEYPVTDVTWYEAAAYAELAGKSLPTIFQWEKAARGGAFTHREDVVMPWGLQNPKETSEHRANFEGEGTVAVESYEFGVSPYGCYNMAGNVKEWCLNAVSEGYATTGGSWEDPQYLFAHYGNFSGFYSSSSLGFRCVRNTVGATGDQGAMKLSLEDRTPSYSAVNEATFRAFLPFYKYDERPMDAQVVETEETPDWTRQKVIFAGVDDDRIIANLFLPKRAKKPFQCINFIPHAGVFAGITTPAAAEHMLAPQIKSGRAVLAVVPKGALEREWEPGHVWPEINTVKYREQTVHYATEFSLGLDYLATRDDIDMDKLAYIGVSWGAHGGLIFAAVENRYHSVILIGGGLRQSNQKKLPEANPINFVPYIKPPKLLLNGKYDEVFPFETHARPLYDLLSEPKELALVDGGHTPPLEERVPIINKWLDETLGPVKYE